MNHYWMDIWPPHKEVDVTDEPEQILEAINDRGITCLVIQDMQPVKTMFLYERHSAEVLDPAKATFLRETVSSAESRIKTVVAYSPDGRTDRPDIFVRSCSEAEKLVQASIRGSQELSESLRKQLQSSRSQLIENGRITESYRRITLSDAVGMLTNVTETGITTRRYIAIM